MTRIYNLPIVLLPQEGRSIFQQDSGPLRSQICMYVMAQGVSMHHNSRADPGVYF